MSLKFLLILKLSRADLAWVDPLLLDKYVLGTFSPAGSHMRLGVSLSLEPLLAAGTLPVIFGI